MRLSTHDAKLFQPLMPLGVDHGSGKTSVAAREYVFQPLMPLGVDHSRTTVLGFPILSGVSTFDAVRR